MKLLKFYILLSIGLGEAGLLSARQLSPTEALARVKAHLTVPTRSAEAAPELAYTGMRGGGNLNTLYVFNHEGGGFLVVSADDAAAPLLGYSDSGRFDADAVPPAMQYWFDCYGAEIEQAAAGAIEKTTAYTAAEARADIEPLIHTKWHQIAPYNDLCPIIDGEHCLTGCSATVMAQIMKYHNYPLHGTGSHSYTPKNIKKTLSADFGATTYNWEAMLDEYDADSPDESKEAVATLMYHAGIAANTEYSGSGSYANSWLTMEAFIEYFNYDKGIMYLVRDFYPLSEWKDIVYDQLRNRRPVLYGGVSEDYEGHAFVCDGYQYRDGEDYFHINWGWGGMNDGYFLLTALDPDSQGTGGSTGGYNFSQSIVTGIQPPVEGSTIRPQLVLMTDLTAAQSTYDRQTEEVVIINGPIGIYTVDTLIYQFGLKLTNTDGTIYLPEQSAYVCPPASTYQSCHFNITDFPQEGTYTVTPIYMAYDEKGNSSGPYDVLVPPGIGSLTLTATPTSLTFSPNTAGISETETENAAVYPNPAADYVTVSASGAIERITVIDLSGSVQLSVAGNSDTRQTVDISRLPAGHYLVRIATAQNTITHKLIVQ